MEDRTEIHVAAVQEKPVRLQDYGVGIFPALSTKSALKKALKKQLIFVNEKLAKTATLIYGNETIVFRPLAKQPNQRPFLLKLEVIYEDDHIAVINKPAGILVSGNAFKTVANALEHNLKTSSQADAVKPQPAHRLDFATTGLLLIGKTSSSLASLNKLFENQQIVKTYCAITLGKMPKNGSITIPVDDKEAVSNFEVLEVLPSESYQYLNLVSLSPKTGRRHQLRKHVSALGNPILGDATYGIAGRILKGKGLYLHAFSLTFSHPITNEKMDVTKELPLKFKRIFKKNSYWKPK